MSCEDLTKRLLGGVDAAGRKASSYLDSTRDFRVALTGGRVAVRRQGFSTSVIDSAHHCHRRRGRHRRHRPHHAPPVILKSRYCSECDHDDGRGDDLWHEGDGDAALEVMQRGHHPSWSKGSAESFDCSRPLQRPRNLQCFKILSRAAILSRGEAALGADQLALVVDLRCNLADTCRHWMLDAGGEEFTHRELAQQKQSARPVWKYAD